MAITFSIRFDSSPTYNTYVVRFRDTDPATPLDTKRIVPESYWARLGHKIPRAENAKLFALAHAWAADEVRRLENDRAARGPQRIYRVSHGRAVLPFTGRVGDEQQIPPLPPIELEAEKQYVIVSTRTKTPVEDEEDCRKAVERTIGVLSITSDPSIFVLPVHVGWISLSPPTDFVEALVMLSEPQTWSRDGVESSIKVARKILASDPENRDRFDLVARLFVRALALPPSDDMLLWFWTCLEVFPMCGSSQYRKIADYLASGVGQTPAQIADGLEIKHLHELRSKLVHSGATKLGRQELYDRIARLQAIVTTVMRSMCGLPYDGRLKDHFVGSSNQPLHQTC